MNTFGPIRNLWEGGSMGEGILRLVKHHIPSVQLNWHICATNKFYQQKSIQRILDQVEPSQQNSSNTKSQFFERAINIHIYGNEKNLTDAYNNGQPISVLVNDNNEIFSIIDSKKCAAFFSATSI